MIVGGGDGRGGGGGGGGARIDIFSVCTSCGGDSLVIIAVGWVNNATNEESVLSEKCPVPPSVAGCFWRLFGPASSLVPG